MSAIVTSSTPPEERDFWRTPPALFARLDATYGPFALDAAANAANHLCPRWFGPGGRDPDALRATWANPDGVGGRPLRAFCNPPYARGMIDAFARKAAREARLGHARTTLLVLLSADQAWWHDLVWDADRGRFRPGVEVEFPRGRVRFLRPDGRPAGQPTFPSVIVTFGGWL